MHFCISVWTYESKERISTQIRIKHDGLATSFHDIPIDQMPRFRSSESRIIQVKLPRTDDSGHAAKLNPENDLKFSMSFSHNKLLLPWIHLYNANEKSTLNKLSITFQHDEFDVLRLSSVEPQCKQILPFVYVL